MKRLTLIGLLALAVAMLLALPGSALAKGGHAASHANRGNHCGQGHAKHTGKVGKSCQKLKRNGTAESQGNPADDPQGDGNDDQANDDDQGDDNDSQIDDDDQGDDNDDQGDDDQGEDDAGSGDG